MLVLVTLGIHWGHLMLLRDCLMLSWVGTDALMVALKGFFKETYFILRSLFSHRGTCRVSVQLTTECQNLRTETSFEHFNVNFVRLNEVVGWDCRLLHSVHFSNRVVEGFFIEIHFVVLLSCAQVVGSLLILSFWKDWWRVWPARILVSLIQTTLVHFGHWLLLRFENDS